MKKPRPRCCEKVDGHGVSFRKIGDVDIVSNTGAIGRGIVIAEYLEAGSPSSSSFQRQRYQVSFGIVQFADFAAIVCARRVEVAERNRVAIHRREL